MTSLVFVHGAGVRQIGYDQAFAQIERQIAKRKLPLTVFSCYWGDECGSRLNLNGACIPTYAATQRGDALSDEEIAKEQWRYLYEDPLFELRLLAVRKRTELSEITNDESPGDTLRELTQGHQPTGELQAALADTGMVIFYGEARDIVAMSPEFAVALAAAHDEAAAVNVRDAVARAIFATCLVLWEEKNNTLFPIDGTTRDELVDLIVANLGGVGNRSLLDWVKQQAAHYALGKATSYGEDHRGKLSNVVSPAAGDVLLYVSQRMALRNFIKQTVKDTVAANPGPLILLAHSLGSIAAVELLAEQALTEVSLLVTAGSPSGYLFEIGALQILRYPSGRDLPVHFPPWINFWDKADFISYLAQPVFNSTKGVEDMEVDNGQPFPNSHSGYWSNSQFWNVLAPRIPTHG